ncbi:MAG: 2Fe-2S iron-sulfur cluster binding domain-containing protein [Candidatus Hydrogenedentes bacterium]|nr:2Fe-2S iron-sulfur cluster binding domain-containing protein [Candidatus Hydrogenedentota bacterium]
MPTVTFEGKGYVRQENETVLDCLLRNGIDVSYSCKSGVCQSCLLQAVSGELPKNAQIGLRDTHLARQYFLSCSCLPNNDLEVCRPDAAGLRAPGVVRRIDLLNASVARLRVHCPEPPAYRAGQFFSLIRPDGLVRSYSAASLPSDDDFIEFHVALVPGGRMSEWVHRDLKRGDALDLQGPAGNCFYVPGNPGQPILLAGTGTGLAPLYGILRDALAKGHSGPIHLCHGSVNSGGLYLDAELRRMMEANPQFHYSPCVLNGNGDDGIPQANIDAYALSCTGPLKGWKVYLCGHPDIVRTLQRKAFLAGANLQSIYADAFVSSADS